MIVKFQEDSHWVDTEKGISFLNDDIILKMDGTNVAAVFKRIFPFLREGVELNDLFKNLTSPQKVYVENIVNALLAKNLIREVTVDEESNYLTEVEEAIYQAQLTLLKRYCKRPYESFSRYREKRVLIIGDSSLLSLVLKSGIENGLKRIDYALLSKFDGGEEELRALNKIMENEGFVFQLNGNQSILEPKMLKAQLEKYDVVLSVVTGYEQKFQEKLSSICFELEKIFISIVQSKTYLFIGPYQRYLENACWQCVKPSHVTGITDDEELKFPLSLLTSTLIQFELFKGLTGFDDPQSLNGLIKINKQTLEVDTVPIQKDEFCSNQIPYSKKKPSLTEIDVIREISEAFLNESSGIIKHVYEDGLDQYPFFQSMVILRLRNGEERQVVEVGSTPLNARKRALIKSIELYMGQAYISSDKNLIIVSAVTKESLRMKILLQTVALSVWKNRDEYQWEDMKITGLSRSKAVNYLSSLKSTLRIQLLRNEDRLYVVRASYRQGNEILCIDANLEKVLLQLSLYLFKSDFNILEGNSEYLIDQDPTLLNKKQVEELERDYVTTYKLYKKTSVNIKRYFAFLTTN